MPNSIIEKLSYMQRAEAQVMERVTNWADIISVGGVLANINLKAAVIAYSAYYLVDRVQRLVQSEDILDYSYKNLTVEEWDKVRGRLLGEADEAIAGIIPVYNAAVSMLAAPSRVNTCCDV